MFLSIGMLKQNYFLADIFILSAEKQPIKLSWRKIECLHTIRDVIRFHNSFYLLAKAYKDQSAEKEVCFQDLFFLELLRYRYLDVYTILCNRPFVLLSLDDNVFFMNDNYKSIIQNNLSSDEYTEVISVH